MTRIRIDDRCGELLREAIADITVEGAPRDAISGSFGIAGGKRNAERVDVHFDATVDDLITMASRASTLAKRTERHVVQGSRPLPPPPPTAEATQRVAIRRVDFAVTDRRGVAAVELEYDDRIVTGRVEGLVVGLGRRKKVFVFVSPRLIVIIHSGQERIEEKIG